MIETMGHLKQLGFAAPVCVAVHAVFAGTAHGDLLAAGAAQVVSCDTISHASNAISIAPELAHAVGELLGVQAVARLG
jgi:ribose-phosphate pyrophosphokinase